MNAAIEVAENEWQDEIYPESPPNSTASADSYVFNFEEENGRTYHSYKAGKYWGSNDELAQDNERICHTLYYVTLASHHLCPINRNPERILDLGTGTGTWAQEMADRFPDAVITGTDLSPPQNPFVSPNLFFVIDDMEDGLNHADKTFDMIHIRGLDGSIQDWPRLYQECMRCLRPGGYLEHAEYSVFFVSEDDSIPRDGAIILWNRLMLRSYRMSGMEIHAIDHTVDRFSNAGLTNIYTEIYPWPIRGWADEPFYQRLGFLNREHVNTGLENWALRRFTRDVGWEREEVIVLCAQVRRELDLHGVHAIQQMRVVYGQKPSDIN